MGIDREGRRDVAYEGLTHQKGRSDRSAPRWDDLP